MAWAPIQALDLPPQAGYTLMGISGIGPEVSFVHFEQDPLSCATYSVER